jgi:hypothetical protein
VGAAGLTRFLRPRFLIAWLSATHRHFGWVALQTQAAPLLQECLNPAQEQDVQKTMILNLMGQAHMALGAQNLAR